HILSSSLSFIERVSYNLRCLLTNATRSPLFSLFLFPFPSPQFSHTSSSSSSLFKSPDFPNFSNTTTT
ncbi:unnamed protein product, partial [Arabidopsis halleri]